MTEPQRLSRGKAVAFGTIAVVVMTVGTVALLEGAASGYLFVRDYLTARAPSSLQRPHTVPDTLLGWRNARNVSSADEYGRGTALTFDVRGFRTTGAPRADSAAPPAAPPAALPARVLCSGDELTLGVGVADDRGWCALLAHELPGVDAVNMGVEGYGIDQSVLRYRRDGAPLAPRVHLLAITQEGLERSVSGSADGWYKPYLALRSGHVVTRNVPVPHQDAEGFRQVARDRAVDELRTVQQYRHFRGFDHDADVARAVDTRMPLFETLFADLAAADRARGTRLVLAYLPSLREARRDDDPRRRRLAAWAREHRVAYVDLTPAMHAMRPDSLDLAFIARVAPGASDGVMGQYSDLGNAWIARVLASRLVTLGAVADSESGAPAAAQPRTATPTK
jgi:hypothetical protein